MRALLAILFAAAAAAPHAQAQGGGCAPYRTPIHLSFETVRVDPVFNNRLNVTGIRNLFTQRGQVVAGRHQQTLGVTYVETRFSLEGSSRTSGDAGRYCVYLERVQAEFGWRRMEVFVASEYPPGSCEYRAVLDHENQHVGINNTVLREYAPLVRAELERLLREQQPMVSSNPKAAGEQALRRLHVRMDAVLDRYEQALSSRNAVIDSTNNYAAINELCRDWDKGNVWPEVDGRR